MKLTKKLLVVVLALFILGGAVYFNSQYEEYCKMEQIASLEQVDYDLEGVKFWRQQETAINIFILVSIFIVLGIAGAHAGEKKQIKKNVRKWRGSRKVNGPNVIQALLVSRK